MGMGSGSNLSDWAWLPGILSDCWTSPLFSGLHLSDTDSVNSLSWQDCRERTDETNTQEAVQ